MLAALDKLLERDGRKKLDVLLVKRVAVEMALDTLSARRFWKKLEVAASCWVET